MHIKCHQILKNKFLLSLVSVDENAISFYQKKLKYKFFIKNFKKIDYKLKFFNL